MLFRNFVRSWYLTLRNLITFSMSIRSFSNGTSSFTCFHFLNKRSQIINKCHRRNKFVLALYDGKDWIKFSVTAFEQPCLRNHSFLKFDCFASSWSQPGFRNQCFPGLFSLFSNHAYEITVSPSLVSSQFTWNQSDYGRQWFFGLVKLQKLWKPTLHKWRHIKDTITL